MFFVSVRTRSNFSPARNVRSTTAPSRGLQLRADERAALAGLDVLELDDAPRLPVELDVHPVAELVVDTTSAIGAAVRVARLSRRGRGLSGSPSRARRRPRDNDAEVLDPDAAPTPRR